MSTFPIPTLTATGLLYPCNVPACTTEHDSATAAIICQLEHEGQRVTIDPAAKERIWQRVLAAMGEGTE